MQKPHFTQEQLVQVAKLSDADLLQISTCRGAQNQEGYGYQFCHVKLFNRFPNQSPFEVIEELAIFNAVQLALPKELLQEYALQKWTFFHHQEAICTYLKLEKFNPKAETLLEEYLFQEAQQIYPIDSLLIKATEFLKAKRILNPSDDTILRLIQTQREKARKYIFEKITSELTQPLQRELDNLLIVGTETFSKLYQIKEVPKNPSAKAMKLLANKLTIIEQTGVLSIKLDWLNNNYKRYLSKYVIRCDANRLRELEAQHRYASLICFLLEAYQDTKDHIFDMYRKSINRVYEQAERTVDTYNKKKRNTMRSCLISHKKLCSELLAVTGG